MRTLKEFREWLNSQDIDENLPLTLFVEVTGGIGISVCHAFKDIGAINLVKDKVKRKPSAVLELTINT